MKIYIFADMEGISGIRVIEQVQSKSPEYAEGRQLMIDDINAAVEAAFDAGADEVVVCDTHGGGGQVILSKMDPRAMYETPNCGKMMPSLDETFDGVILLGHHAMAGTENGFLDHTMSSVSWFEYRLNGRVFGEIAIGAAYAGHYNVPVIAVTGDDAACSEAVEFLENVECAVVKWGIGRNRAKCLSLPRARICIRTAVQSAIENIDRFSPFKPELPATIHLTYYRSDMADDMMSNTGIRRVDARTIEININSLLDVCRF
jgi:D-amino peptidase